MTTRTRRTHGLWFKANVVLAVIKGEKILADWPNSSACSHDDFEHGSLAIHGRFLHHLRVPWGPDATQRCDDLHLDASAGSLTIMPPDPQHRGAWRWTTYAVRRFLLTSRGFHCEGVGRK